MNGLWTLGLICSSYPLVECLNEMFCQLLCLLSPEIEDIWTKIQIYHVEFSILVQAGVARKERVVKGLEILISESICGGMERAELAKAEEKECWLMQQDLKMEQTKDKKNALESYVYEMRDKILNTYQSFANESEREEISRKLQKTGDWLYEDGMDESENVYSEKLENLKKLVDPIENRYKDEAARVQATRDLLKCIADYRMAAGSLSSIKKDAVTDECNKAERWLQEKSQQQDSLPKDVDPMVWSSEIKRKAEALEATCKYMTRSNASPPRRDDLNMT